MSSKQPKSKWTGGQPRRPRVRGPRHNGNTQEANYTSGLPRTRTATVHYSSKVSLGDPSGTLQVSYWRANSPWDPQFAAGGHSAFSWNVWLEQYNHQVTTYSEITLRVSSVTDDTAVGIYIADDNVVPYSEAEEFIEARRGTNVLIPKNITSERAVHGKFNAKTFFSVDDVADNATRIGSAVEGVATDEALFVIWAQGLEGNTWKLSGMLEITYHVIFSEPKDLAPQAALTRPLHPDYCSCIRCKTTKSAQTDSWRNIPSEGEPWTDLHQEV